MPLRRERGLIPKFYIDDTERNIVPGTLSPVSLPPIIQTSGPKINVFNEYLSPIKGDGSAMSFFSSVVLNVGADMITYTIRNDGTENLIFDIYLINSTGKFEFVSTPTTQILLPGEIYYFDIKSLNGIMGTNISQVKIESNDSTNNPFIFNIQCTVLDNANTTPVSPPMPVSFSGGNASVITNALPGINEYFDYTDNIFRYKFDPHADGTYHFWRGSMGTGGFWAWNNNFYTLNLRLITNTVDGQPIEIWSLLLTARNLEPYFVNEMLTIYAGSYCRYVNTAINPAPLAPAPYCNTFRQALQAEITYKNISVPGSPLIYTYEGSISGFMRIPTYLYSQIGKENYYADVTFFAE